MRIIAQCPRCRYRWWLDAAAIDRRLRCRKCFRLLKIPDMDEMSDAAAVVNQAASKIYVDDTGRIYG